jgi:hypothetical protein
MKHIRKFNESIKEYVQDIDSLLTDIEDEFDDIIIDTNTKAHIGLTEGIKVFKFINLNKDVIKSPFTTSADSLEELEKFSRIIIKIINFLKIVKKSMDIDYEIDGYSIYFHFKIKENINKLIKDIIGKKINCEIRSYRFDEESDDFNITILVNYKNRDYYREIVDTFLENKFKVVHQTVSENQDVYIIFSNNNIFNI